MAKRLWEALGPHVGKTFGTIIGLLLGWIIIRYGLLRGLFVAFCVAAGFIIGGRYDSHGKVSEVIDRFMR